MASWISTKTSGVYYREHPTRKHGPRPDRYYAIKYRLLGKAKWESLGWASQGWTVDKATAARSELRENQRRGSGPQTLQSMREKAAQEHAESQASRSREEITLGAVATRYLAWAEINKATWKDDKTRWNLHIKPVLGARRLAGLTSGDIEDLKATLLAKVIRKDYSGERTLAPATIKQCLALVRGMINYASETPFSKEAPEPMFSGQNPARISKYGGRGIKLPTRDSRRLRILTEEEFSRLLEEAQGLRGPGLHDAIILSWDTGLRMGEVLSLRPEHVHVAQRSLAVLDTKTRLNRSVYPDLSWDLVRVRAESGETWLFPGRGGQKRWNTYWGKQFDRICRRAGVNDGISDPRLKAVFHSLRHSYATRKLIEGMDIYTLKTLMGHTSISTTERYLHLAHEIMRQRAVCANGAGR